MSPTQPAPGVIPVLLPRPGQSMEEGAIVRWLAQPGDTVRRGDVLFEVETDKAVVEVEAVDEGRLARIVAGEGETVPVGALVAVLADDDAAADAYIAAQGPEPAAPEPAPSPPPAEATAHSTPVPAASGRIPASPLARRAAKERGVALEVVGAGSGPRGRIMLADVERCVATTAAAFATAVPASASGERRPVGRMRGAIARSLTASKQTVPHFYMKATIEADALIAFHKERGAEYQCNLNDAFVLAVSRAVMEFPAFRSQWAGDAIVERPDANIGIAVGLEDGLVVPVLRHADALGHKGIAAESRRIIEAARAGKVEGMGEGSITISNLGMYGVEEFTAIINPPEPAILAVGAVREDVIVKDGTFRAGRRLTLTLSADHRVIDGLLAARFMARLKDLLEHPAWIRP